MAGERPSPVDRIQQEVVQMAKQDQTSRYTVMCPITIAPAQPLTSPSLDTAPSVLRTPPNHTI